MWNSFKLLQCLLWLSNIEYCLTELLCTSSLRKTAFQSPPTFRIPLLGAEVDVLMQRRNTRIGSMYPTHDDLYNDRLAKNAYCGRTDVEIAIKAIQRFTLQLDRSDGRPDLPLQLVATKFNDFVSVCLRTDGPAWTAAIGPLDYLGMKMASFCVKQENLESKKSSTIVFDSSKLCKDIAVRLLDLSDSAMIALPVEGRDAFWNLCFVITRLAVRCILFESELEGREEAKDNNVSLHVKYGDVSESNLRPPSYVLESVLSLDMCVNYSVDTNEKCFVVSGEEVAKWKGRNQL